MISVIATAVLNSFIKHLVNSSFEKVENIDIQGAPSWYMKPLENNTCVYDYEKGDLADIENAKNHTNIKMVRKINGIIEITLYDKYKQINNPKEKYLLKKFSNDPNLKLFVDKNIQFHNLKFKDNSIFIRACIPNTKIIQYQKERLNLISQKITNHRANEAFSELDEEF